MAPFPLKKPSSAWPPLLVGQAMQGPRQAAEPRSPGVVRIAQGRAHQVRRVRRDVATWAVNWTGKKPMCSGEQWTSLIIYIYSLYMKYTYCKI